jgi:hypothetical protein
MEQTLQNNFLVDLIPSLEMLLKTEKISVNEKITVLQDLDLDLKVFLMGVGEI